MPNLVPLRHTYNFGRLLTEISDHTRECSYSCHFLTLAEDSYYGYSLIFAWLCLRYAQLSHTLRVSHQSLATNSF